MPGKGCVTSETDGPALAVFFVYVMVVDFIVLCLAAYKLLAFETRSRLANILFKDGLAYFVVTYVY